MFINGICVCVCVCMCVFVCVWGGVCVCVCVCVRLTPQASPASDVTGGVVVEDVSILGQTGGHDGVRGSDGGLQLDQGNVITVYVHACVC